MKRILILCFLAITLAAQGQPLLRTHVETGDVEGILDGQDLAVYKAIPYAAPPVGDLRWKAPQPAKPWKGVLKADDFAKWPPQPTRPGLTTDMMSEDCLYLGIATPATSASDRLPVMVWIHGGGFQTEHYGGDLWTLLARRGVVIVSIEYRTGALGFMAHPELAKESKDGHSGNYGLLDQIFALQWVQRNISNFGGDPSKVTIFGESAGAISCSILAGSPLAKGLFHGVISQSGGSFGPWSDNFRTITTNASQKGAEQQGLAFQKHLKKKSIKEMRKMKPEELCGNNVGFGGFWPCVDGYVITDDLYRNYERGLYNDVPAIIMTNSDEGSLFTRDMKVEDYQKAAKQTFGEFYDEASRVYPANTDEEAYFANGDAFRDMGFAWPSYAWAKLQARTGKSPAYAAFLAQPSEVSFAGDKKRRGVSHADDILYLNGTFLNQPDKYPAEAAVAEMMQQYWVNFAKTGNPNGKGLPYWPSFNPALPTTMQFSNGASLINVPNREQIDFVDRFFEWQRERTEGERGVKSTTCNPDGTVTFRYWNDNAKEVLVDVQFAGRHPMVKDSKTGAWTVTLGPAAPDMYPYCFIVDGVSMMDPKNPQYFPNEGFKNSLLEMKNPKAPLPHDIRDVEHGQIDYIHYYSASLGATNNAVVYLPPSYKKKPNKKYPVFYLISGTTDTEEVYYKVGRVNYILDNLLAEGAAEEMIVVLPYGNPYKLLPAPPAPTSPQTQFGGDVFSNDLVNDLMPYIEQHYRTINDRDHRAIGGFSRGGNQGLFNGLANLDKFSYLCSYSSFTATNIPNVYDNADDTNSKLHLFWLGVGTDDFLFGNARDYMEFLDKKGIRSVKEFTTDKYGHTWMNAKYFLDHTLRLLFRPEAAEQAMKNGKPAPAATGKEQQFTPGVMARLFPKPIISPDFSGQQVVFRFKAPDAKEVLLAGEAFATPCKMQKDADGVWSATFTEQLPDVFKYYFIVDGTETADPQNMYLSPDKGFKQSVFQRPTAPYSLAIMGKDIEHGTVSYDLNRNEAWYYPASKETTSDIILLVPGKDDTMESWFKTGGADAIADLLIAQGKARPCILTTSTTAKATRTLRADDYPTWTARRQALEKVLKGE